ncbi:hypothetical protein I6I07_15780 [Achromobacter deleyi]|uniref:Uncharacterized protein n=1 Tax=Achromobacter deleyi TaxID=1353891 RepID=A0A7T4B939_9BURK|nr:hypothetical protein [Achromobacter deleyi]QQB37945.1 hypothetical protein I6I07_15780 [Achromobacter deleyi]
MARIEQVTRVVYRSPTHGRTYLTARAAANREAAAMLARKYETERPDPECGGGYHWSSDERLVRVHKRLARLILRQLRRAARADTDKKEM